MLDPPLIPKVPDPIHVEYEAKIVYLLDLLNQERDLRHAHFEVLSEAIMENNRLVALVEEASEEILRLRSQWSLVDDIARLDAEAKKPHHEQDEE